MKKYTRAILATTHAVCVSQAALGASVIPHTSIPGLVDFGVPFTQNGTVVMSEKYDVFRPNREVSDSFKLRPDGYADFVEYHFKHLSPDGPTVEVTRVHVPGIRRAEVDKAVAVYVDQMAKSSGEAFARRDPTICPRPSTSLSTARASTSWLHLRLLRRPRSRR